MQHHRIDINIRTEEPDVKAREYYFTLRNMSTLSNGDTIMVPEVSQEMYDAWHTVQHSLHNRNTEIEFETEYDWSQESLHIALWVVMLFTPVVLVLSGIILLELLL